MNEKKQHGILFKPEMIKAILDGRKTMTRRIMKTQPKVYEFNGVEMYHYSDRKEFIQGKLSEISEPFLGLGDLKYLVGDLLYVKETFAYDSTDGINFFYAYKTGNENYPLGSSSWKSPLFMPKAAARIWLEITDVKVERVQNISEEDAIREGVIQNRDGSWHDYLEPERLWQDAAKPSFQSLWYKINGEESWNSNPFVWAITFKRINK